MGWLGWYTVSISWWAFRTTLKLPGGLTLKISPELALQAWFHQNFRIPKRCRCRRLWRSLWVWNSGTSAPGPDFFVDPQWENRFQYKMVQWLGWLGYPQGRLGKLHMGIFHAKVCGNLWSQVRLSPKKGGVDYIPPLNTGMRTANMRFPTNDGMTICQ